MVAYALDRPAEAGEVEARLGRVEAYYRSLWPVPVRRSGADAAGIGVHVWDAVKSAWRWPSWAQDDRLAAATLYLPLGYERVVGHVAPERAALPLARALRDRPAWTLELTGPWVIAALEPAGPGLFLEVDGLGVGRLFELRFDGGWVWSNRPVAACRFAGIRAEADRDGWRTLAAAEWFMRDRTPYARVHAVPSGGIVQVSPHDRAPVRTRIDALGVWANAHGDPVADGCLDELAHALTGFAASVGRMTAEPVVADLSGGRDSRVVVAAGLAAGLALEVQTNGAEAGEADVAEALVAGLATERSRLVTHHVSRPTVTGPERTFGLRDDAPVLANALAWHRAQEGLRPPSYLPVAAPASLSSRELITMGGAGGEIAHGHYYPPEHAALGELPWPERADRITDLLADKLYGASGASPQARGTTRGLVHAAVEDALRAGLADARALDHFYAAERLRRWGTTAEAAGSVALLLVPEFVRAAFALTPDQRQANALHRAITARLVPEWADVGYYRRPPGVVQPRFIPRLGRAVDRDALTAIVRARDPWADAFDVGRVERAWSALLDGGGGPANERVMQRVIARAAFEDFLREVNDEAMPDRSAAAPAAAVRWRSPGLVRRSRRIAARGLHRLGRMLEP